MGTGSGCLPCKLISLKKMKKAKSSEEATTSEKVEQPVGEHEQGSTVEGGGPRDSEQPVDDSASASAVPREAVARKVTKIFIVYYSTYGHIAALARKVKAGVDSVEGVEGSIYQVPETLSPEILREMKAPPKDPTVPIISANELPAADAIIFGFPTRYGAMAAQMKAFFDSTGQLWKGQLLAGKAAGFFVSTGTQGGGQETTAWTAITQLAHHGMLFVPIGYTFGAGMFKLDEIRGGSPYGAGTYAGDGSRLPSESELDLAEHQGKYTARIVKKLVGTQ